MSARSAVDRSQPLHGLRPWFTPRAATRQNGLATFVANPLILLAEWTSGPLGRHSVSLRPRFQSGLCGQRKRPLLNVPRKPIKSASHPGVVAGVVDLGGEPCRADHPSVELPTPVMMPHRASRAPRQATPVACCTGDSQAALRGPCCSAASVTSSSGSPPASEVSSVSG
jgi:hypothetical protein